MMGVFQVILGTQKRWKGGHGVHAAAAEPRDQREKAGRRWRAEAPGRQVAATASWTATMRERDEVIAINGQRQ